MNRSRLSVKSRTNRVHPKWGGVPRGTLLHFLEMLDRIGFDPGLAIRNANERDWLETEVWNLGLRLEQVAFQRAQLEKLLAEPLIPLARKVPQKQLAADEVEESEHVVWDSRPIFQLSALLAAIRTGLDVCANIIATFLKGYERRHNSIGKLGEKLKAYDGSEHLLCLVRDAWNNWIRDCRSYRDDLIHGVSIRTFRRTREIRYVAKEFGADAVCEVRSLKPRIPVVIPQEPRREQMTREIWFHMSEELADDGFIVSESYGSMTVNGETFTTSRDVTYLAGSRHHDLLEFSTRMSDSFVQFCDQLLQSCGKVGGFAIVSAR